MWGKRKAKAWPKIINAQVETKRLKMLCNYVCLLRQRQPSLHSFLSLYVPSSWSRCVNKACYAGLSCQVLLETYAGASTQDRPMHLRRARAWHKRTKAKALNASKLTQICTYTSQSARSLWRIFAAWPWGIRARAPALCRCGQPFDAAICHRRALGAL